MELNAGYAVERVPAALRILRGEQAYGLGVVFEPQRDRNGITLMSQVFTLTIEGESTRGSQARMSEPPAGEADLRTLARRYERTESQIRRLITRAGEPGQNKRGGHRGMRIGEAS